MDELTTIHSLFEKSSTELQVPGEGGGNRGGDNKESRLKSKLYFCPVAGNLLVLPLRCANKVYLGSEDGVSY